MGNVQSFDPIIDENSRVLILGTMPDAESLKAKQYYASTRNKFWDIICAIFDAEPDSTYEERIKFLKRKGIALWDVIHECTREGSLDREITNPELNNFGSFLQGYSNIRRIYFNGETAERLFRKGVPLSLYRHIELLRLPSTSSAHSIGTQRKVEEWTAIREYLE